MTMDNETHESVTRLLSEAARTFRHDNPVEEPYTVEELHQWATNLIQQEIAKARIDEVHRLDGGDEDWQLYHDERIAELTNQTQHKE